LQYVEQRYYDPAIGRFISPDPIGLAGGLNRYAYCENDPVNAVDPTGLETWTERWRRGLGGAIGRVKSRVNSTLVVAGPLDGLSVGAATTVNSGIDFFFGIPLQVALGFGEGFGSFWGHPSWENVPGLIGDVGTLAGFGELGCGAVAGAGELGPVLSKIPRPRMLRGSISLPGRRYTPDQQALRELVNEVTNGGRKPLSVQDAEAILDLARETNYPGVRAGAGDVAFPSNWPGKGNIPHIHIPDAGRGGHIPVMPGVRPRPK
jgi:hypothetical protein